MKISPLKETRFMLIFLSVDGGNSHLEVDGSAQLSSTNFPVVPIEGDDKRLRCFSMNYRIITGGTLTILVDGNGKYNSY